MVPIVAVTRPTALSTQINGKLAPTVLAPVEFRKHGPINMERHASRAFAMFLLACFAATGEWLTAVSKGDVYRTFDAQKALFINRYKPVSALTYSLTPASRRRLWPDAKSYKDADGKPFTSTYFVKKQLPNGTYPASAATPGTSNHGWGLAADLGIYDERTDTVRGIMSVAKVWAWVVQNATAYGLSWEGAQQGTPGFEPWHLRYTAGDELPLTVTKLEADLAKLGGLKG